MTVKQRLSVLTLGLLLALTVPAQAAIISGDLNFSGVVRVDADSIDFFPDINPSDGQFTVSQLTNTGSFAGLDNTTGQVMDLEAANPNTGVVDPPLTNFLMFDASPIVFHLTFLNNGNLGPNNPIQLTEDAGGTTASISVRGIFTDNSGDVESIGVGRFTTQFPGLTSAQVIDLFTSSPTGAQRSYSATFTATPIPEPGTVSLLVLGGVLLAVGRRFRRA